MAAVARSSCATSCRTLPCGRLTGPHHWSPDPDGVTTFRTHEMRSGWVPSIPRGMRCPHGRSWVSGRRMPHHNGKVPVPRSCSHPPRLTMTRHQSRVHTCSPARPSPACDPRMERASLGLLLELHTPPLLATHVEAGTGTLGTCQGYVTIDWSSDLRNHSLRATSCRTPRFFPLSSPRFTGSARSHPAARRTEGRGPSSVGNGLRTALPKLAPL